MSTNISLINHLFLQKESMKIVICGPDNILAEAGVMMKSSFVRVEDISLFSEHGDADAFINFFVESGFVNYPANKLVLINNVLSIIPYNHSKNIIRFNGWPEFLKRQVWEVTGVIDGDTKCIEKALEKKFNFVTDAPGFIAPRVIAMIVNEAYLALEDKVSTPNEIDVAMKLGTGYPFGPFEWAEKIGIANIAKLLNTLSVTDKSYLPSKLLIQASQTQ